MEFSVSVIIPVYNGERFIVKAINSVLQQPEITEVIVVNDGSTDNSLSIVENLQLNDSRIKIFHHKNKLNKGRSASRNLGIKSATANYIAFLDSDDFYLSNRFVNDKKLFSQNKKTDGVYNAIGAHFYREANTFEKDRLKLTTVREKIKPEELFEMLLYGKLGHFSIDGITVKKSIFKRVGYFDKSLKVSEDTHMFLKMALSCCLETGIINKPVAMRGVHDNNIFNQESMYVKSRVKMYESLIFWASKNKIALEKIDLLLKWLWLLKYKEEKEITKNILYWAYIFICNSKILFSTLSIKYFPLIRLRKKLFPFLFR